MGKFERDVKEGIRTYFKVYWIINVLNPDQVTLYLLYLNKVKFRRKGVEIFVRRNG